MPEVLKRYFSHHLTIDGDEIRLRLARLNFEDALSFKEGLQDVLRAPIERLVAREPAGPEQERDGQGEYVIAFEAICARRRATMTPEAREALEAAERAHEARARTFITDVFNRFVEIERGPMIEQEDGTVRSLASGLEFLDWYAMRDQEVWLPVMMALYRENTLDARQKKALRSPVASRPSSGGPKGRGRRRGTTAGRAGTRDSAQTEAATATSDGPSGSMARS